MTSTQWKALIAAFLGWMFDGLDGYLYVMVANRFVAQLLHKDPITGPTDPETIQKATIIQSVFLVGWALGGAFFGRVGDRLGRARTLTLTVLTYAVFTGLSYFSQEWWHLLIFRFVAALGIGGEWAAGSALVAETLHHKHRSWSSAFLQSGYMAGCICASLTAGIMKSLDPRWVFVVGVVPAFLTVFIRAAVPEPASWKAARDTHAVPPIAALFAPGLARTTILVTLFSAITVTMAWAFLFFVPMVVQELTKTWAPPDRQALAMKVAIVYFLVNIAANFFATYFARAVGYRKAFFFMMLASFAAYQVGFRLPLNTTNIYVVSSIAVFFSLGYYGMFPMYIPALFPTLVRTLGAGFTYNAGRLVGAVGVFFMTTLREHMGSAALSIAWLGVLFIPGMILALMLPIPRHELGEDQPAAPV